MSTYKVRLSYLVANKRQFFVGADPCVRPVLRAHTRVRPYNSAFFDCDSVSVTRSRSGRRAPFTLKGLGVGVWGRDCKWAFYPWPPPPTTPKRFWQPRGRRSLPSTHSPLRNPPKISAANYSLLYCESLYFFQQINLKIF